MKTKPPEMAGAHDRPDNRRRTAKVVAVVVVVLLGVGIGALVVANRDADTGRVGTLGDGGTKPQTEADKVEAAYRGFWAANFKAGAIPDPSDPSLAAYATGTQLQAAVSDLQKLRQEGHAIRQVPNSIARSTVNVLSIDGERARLTECSVDDSIVVRVPGGTPAFDYPPGYATTRLYTAELVREHGSWKLASLAREQRWEGVAGCAVGRS